MPKTTDKAEVQKLNSLVSDNLQHLRKSKKKTQAQMGKAAGISSQQFSKYESGQNKMSVGMALFICAKLGVPYNELLGNGPAYDKFTKSVVKDMLAIQCGRRKRFIMYFVKFLRKVGK